MDAFGNDWLRPTSFGARHRVKNAPLGQAINHFAHVQAGIPKSRGLGPRSGFRSVRKRLVCVARKICKLAALTRPASGWATMNLSLSTVDPTAQGSNPCRDQTFSSPPVYLAILHLAIAIAVPCLVSGPRARTMN